MRASAGGRCPPPRADERRVSADGERVTGRRRLLHGALTLGLVVASCLVVEVAVRAYFASQVGPRILLYGTPWQRRQVQLPMRRDSVQVHGNDVGGYTKYFPNETKTTQRAGSKELVRVRINSQGFRGDDFSVEKPPGTLRVLTLGASSTFGYHNADDETYPYYLEQILNRRQPDGPRFEVINFAIPHFASADIVTMFLAEGIRLQPDFVTLYEGVNDSKDAFFESRYGGPWQALRRRVLTLDFLGHLLAPTGPTRSDEWREQVAARRSEVFLANLTTLLEECRRRHIRLIVATQQAHSLMLEREKLRGLTYAEEVEWVKARLGSQESSTTGGELGAAMAQVFLIHARLMHDLREWARTHDVDLVDLIAVLDQRRDLLVSWVHLYPEANRMVAEALAAEILEHVDGPATAGVPRVP